MRFETTLGRAVRLRGTGLHSGEECEITLHPAEADFGLAFQVCGQALGEPSAPLLPVHYDLVTPAERCTSLGKGGAGVLTVEHLLAALQGMEVDNALIEVEGGEVPALDGSAEPFARAIAEAEVVEAADADGAPVPRRTVVVSEPVTVTSGKSRITVLPGSELWLSCWVEYPDIGEQRAEFEVDPDTFRTEIAPARTFALECDLEELRAKGLGRGGSLDNAIVVGSQGFSSPPRFDNELARHKLLDLLGDLALLGTRLSARVVAFRPGHQINRALVRRLAEVGERAE